MNRLFIVVPAHNEEKRIVPMLEAYGSFFQELKSKEVLDTSILVVINGTTDNTESVVKSCAKKHPLISSISLIQGGKGYAVIQGFKESLKRGAEYVGFVDADNSTPPEAFYDLIRMIGSNGGAIANRWIPESKIQTKQTLLRQILSRGFNFIVRAMLFLPYNDTQCGAKLFRKDLAEHLVKKTSNTRWAFDVELLFHAKKGGFRVTEVPTIWQDKGESKLNIMKVPFQMFTGVCRLRLNNSPFSFAVRAYDSLPESLKIHHNL